MSNGFIRLCSMVYRWAAISACHALLSSHMTNKDDDDDDVGNLSECVSSMWMCVQGRLRRER